MAYLATGTNAGTRKQVNEDACCVEVAATPLGEVLMAVVCDGVGGLAKGNVASSTVISRFDRWFATELPALLEGMVAAGRFDFALVKAVWDTLLQRENELIRTHGAQVGARLGTTFTGMLVCGGRYLLGHVGDCRAYRMGAAHFEQLTEDQTLVAKQLAEGSITPEEAARAPKNVILQAVGTQRVLRPVFYEGELAADELVVICCDGAYHRAENEGIRKLFQGLDYCDELALETACQTLLQFDMDCGEKDNLTVVCFAGALAAAGEVPVEPVAPAGEDDLPTMVEAAEELPAEAGEDDLPTMIADEAAADTEPESDEDDLPTMVEDADEDDLATMVAASDEAAPPAGESPSSADLSVLLRELSARLSAANEDELGTVVVADDGSAYEDDEDEDDDFGLPTFDDDDDLPTEVGDEQAVWALDPDDDLPTLVDGGDA